MTLEEALGNGTTPVNEPTENVGEQTRTAEEENISVPSSTEEQPSVSNGDAKPVEEKEVEDVKVDKAVKKLNSKSADKAFMKLKRQVKEVPNLKNRIRELETQLAEKNKTEPKDREDYDERIRLATKIEMMQEQFTESLHDKQVETCFTDEAQKERYLEEVAPHRVEFMSQLKNINPVVHRYVSNSNSMPLLLNAFNSEEGQDILNAVTDNEDPMNIWLQMVKLESILKTSQKQATAVVPEQPKPEVNKEQEQPKKPKFATNSPSASGTSNNSARWEDKKSYKLSDLF